MSVEVDGGGGVETFAVQNDRARSRSCIPLECRGVIPVLVSDPSRVDVVEAVVELVDGEDHARLGEVCVNAAGNGGIDVDLQMIAMVASLNLNMMSMN